MVGIEWNARAAGGGQDAAPVGVCAGDGCLHKRREGDGLRGLLRGSVTRRAAHFNFDHVRCAFAVLDDSNRKGFANLFECGNEFLVIRAARFGDFPCSARAVRKGKQRVVSRAVTVHGDAIECAAHHVAQRDVKHAGLDRRVSDDEGKHRRHVGMNHPGALGASSDAHCLPTDAARCGGALRARIRCHDRTRQAVESVRRKCERFGEARRGFQDSLDGQRHADHARRAHDHLLRAAAKQFGNAIGGGARSDHAARPDRAVGVPGIDDDGAHRPRGGAHVLARKDDRGRLHEILREHGRGRRRRIGNDHRDVERPGVAALLQATGRRSKTKPARQGAGRWKFSHFFPVAQPLLAVRFCRSRAPTALANDDRKTRTGRSAVLLKPARILLQPALQFLQYLQSIVWEKLWSLAIKRPRVPFPLRSGQGAIRALGIRPRPWQSGCTCAPWDT